MPSALESSLNGIPVVLLEAGGYRAAICAELGANCVFLGSGEASFLRTPSSPAELRAGPNVFGLPLLFPPNRIAGGAYSFNGRRYELPINEPERGHHIHGFLSSSPFRACSMGDRGEGAWASFAYEAGPERPYPGFPHRFRITLTYRLGPEGLGQDLRAENLGAEPMPLGLGFHAAFSSAFLPATASSEYRLKLSVDREIPTDPASIIPAGERIGRSELLDALRGAGVEPDAGPLSRHFSAAPGPGLAELEHLPTRHRFAYRVDPAFRFWTLWNGGGGRGFVCPEPQTWTIDAPNSSLPSAESGFRALAPGESAELRSRLYETRPR